MGLINYIKLFIFINNHTKPSWRQASAVSLFCIVAFWIKGLLNCWIERTFLAYMTCVVLLDWFVWNVHLVRNARSSLIASSQSSGFPKWRNQREYEEWADSWARREGHMAETSKALPIPRIVSLQSDNPGNNGLSLWQWPRQCPKMSNNVWPLWHKTGRWGGGAGLIHENCETFGKRASATIQSFIHTRTNHP